MIPIKINKHLKVEKYLNKGIKFSFRYKKKSNNKEWNTVKLNEYDLELLEFTIKVYNEL